MAHHGDTEDQFLGEKYNGGDEGIFPRDTVWVRLLVFRKMLQHYVAKLQIFDSRTQLEDQQKDRLRSSAIHAKTVSSFGCRGHGLTVSLAQGREDKKI